MMRPHTYIVLTLSILAVLSCKKTEVPDSISTEPVFNFSAEINGNPVVSHAGKNSYLATSGVDLAEAIHTYYGGISEGGCVPICGEGLVFRFRSDEDPEAGQSLKRLFDSGNVPFYKQPKADPITTYTIQMTMAAEGATAYHWQFSNGMESSDKNPMLEIPFEENTTFLEACVTVKFSSGCQITDCDNVYLPHAPCAVDFSYSPSEIPNAFDFQSEVKSERPTSFNWDFSSGGTATTSEVRYFYSSDGSTPADVVDLHVETNGCTASHREMVPLTSNAVCLVNFDYEVSKTVVEPAVDSVQSGTVEVLWMDASGQLYSSSTATQSNDSYFTISTYEEYADPNHEPGMKSLKTQISFELFLEGNGKILHMKDGKATVPVGLGFDQL